MNKRNSDSAVKPRKEPQQKRARQTYQVILQGAAKIIRKFGVQKLSTNKVAEESGVSIGSLYQYFPSKEAIIAALIDQTFEYEYLRMKERFGSLSPQIGAREAFQQVFAQYYILEPEDLKYRKVMIDAVALVAKNAEALKFHKAMAELILNFTCERYKSPQDKTSISRTIFIIQYMLRASALSSIDKDLDKIDVEKLIEELSELLMNLLKIPAEYREAMP